MMPNGWKEVKLGEIFDFRNGINADKSQYGQGVKFVNVMDVFGNHILTESKIIGRISISDKKLNDNRLEYGDVLFNRTSETFDEIAMSAVYLDNADATFGGFVIRGRPLTNKLDPRYTVYAFQDSNFRKQVIKLGQGAIRANIGQKDLVKVKLLVPPLQEQQKIAKILSTRDKAISTTERLIENSTQQKKALMQQLLTCKKRLLDDEGKRFEGEWESKTLSDIAVIKKGKALSSRHLEAGDFPVIAGGKTSPYNHSKYTHEDVITISASGAYAGYVAYHKQKIWASDCSVVKAKIGFDLQFIYQYLLLNQIRIYSFQSGGAQPHIYPKDIEVIKIKVPDIDEQQKIATLLINADQEIELLEQQLAYLQQEKKALMQVLLTGKKRVVVADEGDGA